MKRSNERSNEEVLVLVTENGKPTGKFASRTECHRGRGIPHLAIVTFPFDEKGFLAVHVRSRYKLGGSRWDTPSTHVFQGESVGEAVARCLRKEYGVRIKGSTVLDGFRYRELYDGWAENEFCYPVHCEYEGEIVPNPNEMARLELAKLGEVIRRGRLFPREYTLWMRLGLTALGRHLNM